MAVGDIYRVAHFCRHMDQLAVNVCHYRVSLQVGNGAPQQAQTHLWSQTIGPVYKPLLTTGSSYLGCTMQRIMPKPPTLQTQSSDGAGPGTVAGDVLPNQVTGIISHFTAFAGRRYRGRIYVAFPGEADSEVDGSPSASYAARLGSLATSMRTLTTVSGPDTTTLVQIVWHRDTQTGDDVISPVGKRLWGTQRRRGLYGAVNPDDPF